MPLPRPGPVLAAGRRPRRRSPWATLAHNSAASSVPCQIEEDAVVHEDDLFAGLVLLVESDVHEPAKPWQPMDMALPRWRADRRADQVISEIVFDALPIDDP
jgi:hypothetical protein